MFEKSIRPLKLPSGRIPTRTAPALPGSRSSEPVPLAVITALIFTSLVAVKVSLLLLQLTTSLTLTSPSEPLPLVLRMLTLPLAKFLDNVAPDMSPPLAATVKPSGSSHQTPELP